MRAFLAPLVGAAAGTMVVFGVLPIIGDLIASTRPPELWLEITDLQARDTIVGKAPIVTAKRTIHRSLLAKTRVTLRRLDEEDGLYVVVCSRATERHFIPQSQLPDNATLNYWAEVPPNLPCLPREPGVHVVSLWVTVEGEGTSRTKPIELMSNQFTVRP